MAFPGDWSKKRQLTIPAAQVGSGGVSSYTAILKVTATSAESDGRDLRVTTDEVGSNLLTVDVLEAVGSGVFWIRVGPISLSSVSVNTLYLWSGNASASAQTGSDAYDSDWAAYWDKGSGADRTANANNSTANGGVSVGGTSGKVGAATTFDGSNDSATVGQDASINNLSTLTYMAWTNRSGDGGGALGRIIDKRNANSNGGAFLYNNQPTNGYAFEAARWQTSDSLWTMPRPSTGVWAHVAVTYDHSSTANNAAMFLDSASQSVSKSGTPSGSLASETETLVIGNSAAGTRGWNGLLDDVQVHSAVRSAAWIATEYNATNAPESFLTQGDEEDAASGGANLAATRNYLHFIGGMG